MDYVANYLQKISSAFQGSGSIRISTFVEDHLRMQPLLHLLAQEPDPDMSALIYSLLRLPPEILSVKNIIMGQSDRVFDAAEHSITGPDWKVTKAIARTRRCHYNASTSTLAVCATSLSDIHDLVTMLTALYIEFNKLNQALSKNNLRDLSACFTPADWKKLTELLGERLPDFIAAAKTPTNYELTLLSGSNLEYTKAVQEWWINIASSRKKYHFNIYNQPVYFVSSNSHSLINLLSGFPYFKRSLLRQVENERLNKNTDEFKAEQVTEENICYYLSRFAEAKDKSYRKAKISYEEKCGLIRLPAYENIDIDAQIFSIKDFVRNAEIDRRLQLKPEQKLRLLKSNALIFNIAYPLGLNAYNILKEVSENVTAVRGVYIMGKAASLNAGIGDITIPQFVLNKHTNNQIFLHNTFNVEDFQPYFPKNSIFSEQKAVTVPGTFLQNEDTLQEDYQKGYSIIEMEAGPYLERVYEMQYPNRYPVNDTFVLRPRFRLGAAYYVSDTPQNKGVNLGAKRLTWEGLNATYAISIGILNDIIKTEDRLLRPHD